MWRAQQKPRRRVPRALSPIRSALPWTRGGESATGSRPDQGRFSTYPPPLSICGTAGRANRDLRNPNPRRKLNIGPQIRKKIYFGDFDVLNFFFRFSLFGLKCSFCVVIPSFFAPETVPNIPKSPLTHPSRRINAFIFVRRSDIDLKNNVFWGEKTHNCDQCNK